MEHNKKVFASDIIRSNNSLNNNLYDLLQVVPAKSLSVNTEHTSTCDFKPNTDKYYVPKKKSKLKVKTVRNIRELFEKEIYSDLHIELEKHRHSLLRKIRIGSSREEATKKMAKIIFRSDSPISKDIWQMLTHLNPEGHPHSAQFVLWNRRSIQINGSKGGKNKFICNFDIGKDNIKNLSKPVVKLNKDKKTMLQKSIYVKFKPGPLSKKKFLDSSYQKFHYGNSTVVNLPKPGLDIQPLYGIPLGPTITKFINDNYMRNSNGEITDKWAEFSLSVLGVNKNGCPLQLNKDACISFDMQYKCNQHRILMRNAIDNNDHFFNRNNTAPLWNNQTNTTAEVNIVMSKILDYVEIKLDLENQNNREEDDVTYAFSKSYEKINGKLLKEKGKRKFGELDRLDVTVIRLSSAESKTTKCEKIHCSLGCICGSLECSYNLKSHCGRIECMFECKCMQWFSKSSDSSLSLSGLNDLNKTLNSGLAKEEQKFRQTVVFSGEKSILLKPQRRDWKSSKKYAEFYSNMCLKTETKIKKVLFVVIPKLNCNNIEPWCMIHNLYKCFCKGKFTERALPVIEENDVVENVKEINESAELLPDKNVIEPLKNRLRRRSLKQSTETITIEQNNVIKQVNETHNEEIIRCARLSPYKGKKYTDDYYSETNRKIIEMEKNDRSLQKKMMNLINVGDEKEKDRQSNAISPKGSPKRLPNRRKLVAWLEASYKHYKECKDKGLVTTSLEPPNETKLAFHSWEFILSRYRERKNLFLVTPQKPFRIFMAVKKDHPKLEACVNVKDLVLTDVQEYPATVKNLLTNAIDLKDNFCILRGLSFCWELVGTVTKVSELRDESLNCKDEILNFGKESISNYNTFFDEESQDDCHIENMQIDVESLPEKLEELTSENKVNENKNQNEISKWFVMTIENDFNEIHFYKKGFFVKYDSVIKAINVSRVSNKTVRLSSQKCYNRENNPQFGIYAIPNEQDLNVFIGPYENDESLGIETVKTILPRDNTRQTRGTWIKVNKIDNVKIIDQPLAFLPSTILSQEMFPLEREFSCVKETKTDHESSAIETAHISIPDIQNEGPRITKTVKPIKILKSNGFYKLWPKIATTSQSLATREQNTIYPMISQLCVKSAVNSNTITTIESNESNRKTCKPVAEIAPQIKVTERTENKIPNTNTRVERGMCILKPEEINKRSLLNQNPAGSSIIEIIHDDIDRDVENFLATSTACKLPIEDIYVISDEENDERDKISDVWIQSSNIPNLGWIPAKRNSSNHISFEFPGFKYTDFYTEEEAFRKINLVFSRKVYVPKCFDFNWQIVENEKDLKTKKKLVSNELGSEFVLTSKGLKPRFKLIPKQKEKCMDTENTNVKKRKSALENDNKKLCIEAVSKKSNIMQTISQANNNLRQEMAERLSVLLSDSKSMEKL